MRYRSYLRGCIGNKVHSRADSRCSDEQALMERSKTTPSRVGVTNGSARGPAGEGAGGEREARSLSMERLRASSSFSLPPRPESGAAGRPPTGPEREIKVLLLGPQGVGKSAIVVRYLTKRYIGDYADCESICSGSTVWGYKQIKVHLLDTRGETTNSKVTLDDEKLAWADGVLLVFSIADLSSYEQTERLVEDFLSGEKAKPCAFVVVGHKSDLVHLREVPESLGKRLAAALNSPYIEASARESYGSTVNVFSTLFLEIKYVAKRRNKPGGNSSRGGERRTSSTVLHQLRDSFRCLTNEFRQRTNTF